MTAIHDYYAVHVALDFADKYGASSVTIETDGDEIVMPVSEALDAFDDLAPGEAFSVLNISFQDESE
jgi:hypothetical protein